MLHVIAPRISFSHLLSICFGCLLIVATLPQAQETLQAQEVKWEKVEVFPQDILLKSSAAFQGVIAVATRSDGITKDVSTEAQWALANPAIVQWDGAKLAPTADGETALTANWNGLTAQTKVSVVEATAKREISFHLDVMPVLTRTGCNTGSCHGAARGKDGFRLSLFGFDPVGDYDRITREIGIRRINLAVPAESLMLLKGTGGVQHTGGKRMELDSKYYRTMLTWLEAGAVIDPAAPPTVTNLELFPKQAVLEGEGAKQRMVAVATYSDGAKRDVTELAAFFTNNERSAAIDASGNVTGGARGEAFVMARFDTHTVGSQILALPAGLQYSAPQVAGNYIDEFVAKKLEKLRVVPSDLCTDEEFLRRSTIDITGMLPTEAEYAAFVADTAADKRAKLIDRLLERKEFSEIWAMKWAELLMIKTTNEVSEKSAFLYSSWLTNQIANNVPLDQIVRDLLGSSGGVFDTPATNYYQIERDTLKVSENVAQVFMGIRTQCAQCHNHPFDRWTMDDYYGFAAFFSQIGRKQGEDYREVIVFNSGGGEVAHPVGGRRMEPRFLGGGVADLQGRDRRVVLADWLTSAGNPFFATSVANRIWAHFMGVGIVEPVDDFRVSNPASNPELLEVLGKKLVEYKYDFKQLVRDICNSNAYQRSTMPNDTNKQDERNFSHAVARRIPAEQVLDCISQVTLKQDKFRGLPLGARAVQIANGATSTYFLNTFGRAQRATVCACEASTDPSLSQALHLINGDATNGKIQQGKLIQQLKSEGLNQNQIIEKLFVRCLSRKPTAKEVEELGKLVAAAPDEVQGLEDVFWVVLNSREFIFNH
jgi:hypothetical protein